MKPPSGWLSLIILLLMMLTLTSAMQAMRWTPGLEILSPMVVCAVLVGSLLANREWLPALLAHGWSLVLATVAAAYFGTFNLSDYGLATGGGTGLVARLGAVRDTAVDWLRRVSMELPVDDNAARFVFVLWLAILLWLVAYMAAWFLVRYANWWGIALPSGFALVATLYGAPQESLVYLAAYVFFALVLAGQTNSAIQISRWTRERIVYDTDLELVLLRDGLLVAILVLALGFKAPAGISSALWRQWTSRLHHSGQQVSETFSRLFPSLESPARGQGGTGQAFGNDLPLSGSIDLRNQPVFDARLEPYVAVRQWRMAVYDEFTGYGWRRSASERLAGQVLASATTDWPPLGVVVTQTITVLTGGVRQLFAVPEAIDFDIPVVSEVASWEGQLTADVQTIQSTAPLSIGDRYVVRSHVAIDDVAALRRLEGEDPPWIRDRYLQLPAATSDRTRELARTITAGTDSRYDRAAAIEAYLRQIPYSISINPPPAGQDRVDWFLFEERRGYCDYYASAFVVMARLVGVPARFVAGYATGDYLPQTKTYRQMARHAHTWPEVYFPSRGWVAFEPTASQPALHRGALAADEEPEPPPTPSQGPALATPAKKPANAPGPGPRAGERQQLIGLAGARRLGALLWLVGTVVGLLALWWYRPLVRLSVAEAAFARLCRVAGWLGFPLRPTQTPHEYGRQLGAVLRSAGDELDIIVGTYVAERYGRRPSAESASCLARAWLRVRGEMVRSAPRWLVRRPAGTADNRRPGLGARHAPPPPDDAWL